MIFQRSVVLLSDSPCMCPFDKVEQDFSSIDWSMVLALRASAEL